MRRLVLGAVAAALVFTIGCGDQTADQDDAAPPADALEDVAASPDDAAMRAAPRETVPLTITMPKARTDDDKAKEKAAGNDFIGRVRFPDIRPDRIFARDSIVRIQYLVGEVPRDTVNDRFTFVIETFKGGSGNSVKDTVSFGATAVCTDTPDEPQGTITRIACAASSKGGGDVKGPRRAVCSAIYDYVGDPPDTCEGTYACVKCRGGVRVCSENPQCNN